MYKCKVYPYPFSTRRPPKIMRGVESFLSQWEAESPEEGRLYVVSKCFGAPTRIYIGPSLRHIRKRHLPDVARRLQLLPCVKELLEECEEMPTPTKDGKLKLEGKAPVIGSFCVVLDKTPDEPESYNLVTIFPVT